MDPIISLWPGFDCNIVLKGNHQTPNLWLQAYHRELCWGRWEAPYLVKTINTYIYWHQITRYIITKLYKYKYIHNSIKTYKKWRARRLLFWYVIDCVWHPTFIHATVHRPKLLLSLWHDLESFPMWVSHEIALSIEHIIIHNSSHKNPFLHIFPPMFICVSIVMVGSANPSHQPQQRRSDLIYVSLSRFRSIIFTQQNIEDIDHTAIDSGIDIIYVICINETYVCVSMLMEKTWCRDGMSWNPWKAKVTY